LDYVLKSQTAALNSYFDENKRPGRRKSNLFFVRQNGRLQCLNGAYLSDVDEELLSVLFPDPANIANASILGTIAIETGVQIATIRARIGQARFSSEIRELYGHQCCFPDCGVTDDRFLVGSHVARWSDNETLRGNLGNGVCLCLLHDKAFEIGLFTLDEKRCVLVNPREKLGCSSIISDLIAHEGRPIRSAVNRLLDDALLEHWIRVDIDPYDKID